MNANKNEVFNELITFIVEEIHWAKKDKLNDQTNIVDDLGLFGDDCIEFLENFCRKFNIECSKFDMSKCGQEGNDLIFGYLSWIWSFISKRKKSNTTFGYTLSELIQLIENSAKS